MAKITRLARRRMELDMTQQQVADRAKVPYPTYQKLANGKTKVGDYANVKIRMDAIEEELLKLDKGDIDQATHKLDTIETKE